ncbi:MAG TPA: GNAT family N-acetyltransferase [Clostridiaceae bacterium]
MNYEIRKIEVEELYKLDKLYVYSDLDKFIGDTTTDLLNRKRDIFVIICEEEFIGELSVYYESGLRYETISSVRVYLSAFRVYIDYQNQGLGRKLVEYAIKTLEGEGYSEFTVGVEDDNYNSKHIYNSYGFTQVIDRGCETVGDKTYEYNLLLRKEITKP